MIRIKVLNPIIITSLEWLPILEEGYRQAHDPDTILEYSFLPRGIESPEQHFWEEIQMTYLIQEIENIDQDTYQGALIFCAADPGIAAAKEWLQIPIVGLLETSLALARLLGRRFTWLSPLSCGDGFIHDRIRLAGHDRELASIRSIEVPVVEMHDDQALFEKTLEEGKGAVAEDGADTLIMGCTGMIDLAGRIQECLGIPVIDAGIAGIRMCELLIKMNLAQSKKAYPLPRADMGRRL